MTGALERAIAEWREAHPDDGDLPDEAVSNLTVVRQRAFGIAAIDFGQALAEQWHRAMSKFASR